MAASLRPSPSEVRPIPPAAVGLTFVVKEGPKVKVGKITFAGQQGDQVARTADRDEEPEAHRHSALDLPGKPVLQDLRLDQAERRRRARPLLLPDEGLLQSAGCRSQDQDSRHASAVVLAVQQEARQSGRHHHAGGRGRAVPPERDHVHRQQGRLRHPRPARPVQDQRWRHLRLRGDPQGPRQPAQGLRRAGLHQLLAGAQHRSGRREEDHR